ncbi:MAG: type VI secretion system tip protein VgrG [Pirellulaceae bacterium]|nr:type VI secretion system tip protein VgrG [Pirellulaceae bacterium]
MPQQSERLVQVKTPLGEDVLLFYRATIAEELGRLFTVEIEMLSKKLDIKPMDLLGLTMTLEWEVEGEGTRYFNGHVVSFGQVGVHRNYVRYRATLKPWLWFLTRTADCKIFQEMTVPDILKEVFKDNGFSDIEDSLTGSYRDWVYCVQYRETDFNFVSRLMEQEGIYYYFKHVDGKHTLVLSDDYSAHAPVAEYETIPYFPPDPGAQRRRDYLDDWTYSQTVRTGAYALNDFDFEKPKGDLKLVVATPQSHPQANLEVYDYPGEYLTTGEGDPYVKSRIQEQQADFEVCQGRGIARGLMAGGLFTLELHPHDELNKEYLVVSAIHEIRSDEYETTGDGEGETFFRTSIRAIDSKTPYRSPRITPKPIVQGPQTAIVVGKQGEEIWTDKYGRIKVQFHWDRYGKSDEKSTCWIRVSQYWAGDQWGSIHIPRIGQEVIVEHLEGDPDRPIVTGRVYNADNMPPYALPDNQTQSGIKSRSTKSGNDKTFNELRFEDKKGEEQIYFHAEKDFERIVENNDTLKVGFDKKDKGDQTIEIYNDRKIIVGNNETREIGYGIKDAGDQTIKVFNDRTVTIGNNDSLKVEKGNQTIKISMGKTSHEAMQAIELKVGASSIKIEPASITIKSPQIKIEADAMLTAKGAMTNVEGSAMLILKGGLVKIN